MKEILKPALVLFIICFVVTTAVAFTYTITKDTIAESNKQAAENARKAVLETADKFECSDKLKSIVDDFDEGIEGVHIKEVYEGRKNEAVKGYVFLVNSKGYSGDVEVIIGLDENGNVLGIEIGENQETPGLGKKWEEPEYKNRFNGLCIDESPYNIEAVSGATITSNAVRKAVIASQELFKKIVQGGKGA